MDQIVTSPTATGAPEVPLGRVIVVGVLAGFLAGLFGVGGGILIVPGLVWAARMDQRLAHGTSLAAVLPISVASLITYAAHDHVDWAVGVFLAAGAVAGAVLGTKLLHVLPQRVLAILFSSMLLLSALRLFLATESDGIRSALTVWGAVALVVIGVATGVLAGLLGVGGGIVMVPAMIILFSISPVVAKGTSAFVIIPTAIMGTWRNRKKKNADLRAAVAIGLAGILTAALGGIIADKMSDTVSNVLFATLLVIVAVRMLLQLRRPAHD